MWKFLKRLFGVVMLGVIALGVAGALMDRDKPGTLPKAVIAASQKHPIPAEQASLAGIVGRYAGAYDAAANDMVKGGTRPERASAICSTIRQPDVRDWVGTIKSLSSNSEGNGVLEIQLANSLTVKTWNNGFSDMSDHTLIPHGSALYSTVSALHKGQPVTFSGSFIPEHTDCFRETSMSVSGAMTDPEFVFRFSAVRPLD